MSKQTATVAAQRELAWRDRMARFASSGKSVTAFCHGEGVPAWRFYHWRKRLGGPDSFAVSAASFIDLGAIPFPAACNPKPEAAMPDAAPAGIEIRLDLGGGLVLHIARR